MAGRDSKCASGRRARPGRRSGSALATTVELPGGIHPGNAAGRAVAALNQERKAGKVLRETERAKGAKGIGPVIAVTPRNHNQAPTLAEIGVKKRGSAEAGGSGGMNKHFFSGGGGG